METNPLVSIVIPVYNGSNYMREAIDSALTQTYPNIEIIVVNDGSTDNTREIALSYGDKIRYFEKDNGGVSTALNLAIREMRGEYFSWLSHDDVYYPEKVQAEIEALRQSESMNQVVYSGWDALVMPDKRIESYAPPMSQKYLEIGLLAPIFGFISGCTLMIPKKYFDRYGLFDESLRGVQDYVKWFQMFRDKRLLYVNKSLIQSRMHERQTTYTYGKMHQEEEWLYCWMLESISENDILEAGITPYLFWGAALTRMKRGAFLDAYDIAWEKLKGLEDPTDGMNRRKEFSAYLKGFSSKGIYLYCAGSRGEALIMALQLRDIQIMGISDTDASKWGRNFRGIPCIPLSDIPKDSLIIVTKVYPDDVMDMLRGKGYIHLTCYDALMNRIFETPVIKSIERSRDFVRL